jgi:hypothetical protein
MSQHCHQLTFLLEHPCLMALAIVAVDLLLVAAILIVVEDLIPVVVAVATTSH